MRIGYNPSSNEVLPTSTPYNISIAAGTFRVMKYTASESGYYQISTSRTLGDPVIYVLSSTGLLKTSDDDSGGNLNAFIEMRMAAGVPVYIIVHGYNGNATDLSITVTPKE